MIALALGLAWGQDYIFPTSPADYGHFYPTSYMDHGGNDWNCGTHTYGGHRGNDFGAGSFAGMDAGRDIVAAAPGVVTARNDGEFDRCTTADCAGGGGFGNYVYVQHPNGRTTVYAHLKQWSVRVNVGDTVSCGQKIGEMGSSGYSTGPHIHFQVNNASGGAEDPFDGPCSAPPPYWVSQGAYMGRPGNTCPAPPTCHPVAALACGDTVSARNDGSGSRSEIAQYGCSPFDTTGSERTYTFSTPVSESVTMRLSGLAADLDLFVVTSSSCDGGGCVAGSWEAGITSESLTFAASAGHTYTVAVDGYAGAASAFTLAVECTGGEPVIPDYRAEVVSTAGLPSGTWSLVPGQVVSGTMVIRNIGDVTWPAGNVRLATTDPRDRASDLFHPSWLSGNRVASNPAAVAPGALATLSVAFRAPALEGAYTEAFGLVAEGVTWFADDGGPADDVFVIDAIVADLDPGTDPDPDTDPGTTDADSDTAVEDGDPAASADTEIAADTGPTVAWSRVGCGCDGSGGRGGLLGVLGLAALVWRRRSWVGTTTVR